MGYLFRKRILLFSGYFLAFVIAMMLTLTAVASRADDATTTNSQSRVRIDLVNADLRQAISLLRQQTGADFVIESSDKPYGKVTLSLDNQPLDEVLKLMCESAGASLKVENGIYFIGPKSMDTNKAASTTSQPSTDIQAGGATAPKLASVPQQELHTVKIQLYNTRPSEVLEALGIEQGRINGLVDKMIYAPFDNLVSPYNQMMSRPLVWNNPYSPGMTPEYIPNPAVTTMPVPPSAPINDTATSHVGTNNRVASQVGENDQFGYGGYGGRYGGYGGGIGGGAGGYGGGIGGYGGGIGGYGGGIGGRLGGIGGIGGGIGGRLGGIGGGIGGVNGQNANSLLPQGIDALYSYDVDNSIIARGTDDAIQQLKDVIRLLDVAPKQLMIKAELIQVNETDAKTFGINWSIARGTVQMGNTFGGSSFATGNVYLNYASGNMAAQLLASLSESKGKVVNTPMVTTTNNMPVFIEIGQEIPIITSALTSIGLNQTANIPQINVISITSGLFVIPRINGDNSVTMTITPQIEDVPQTINNPSGGTIPIISTESITVTRRIMSGQTMVIGGLTRKNDNQTVNKVPLLGDLPFIGKLFQSYNNSVNDTELLIFVTPTIISDTTGGSSPSDTSTVDNGGTMRP